MKRTAHAREGRVLVDREDGGTCTSPSDPQREFHVRPDVYIVPGFLSEQLDRPVGPLRLVGGSGLPWARRLDESRTSRIADSYLENWQSLPLLREARAFWDEIRRNWQPQSGIIPALPMVGFTAAALLRLARSYWLLARYEADVYSKSLAERIRERNRPAILIGHSLGGRIVLRAAERLGSGPDSPELAVIAMAAAVRGAEIDWAAIAGRPGNSIELLHSRADLELAFLYRFGELTLSAPVGLTGPQTTAPAHVLWHDVTVRENQIRRGHTDYEPDLPQLLCLTRVRSFFGS